MKVYSLSQLMTKEDFSNIFTYSPSLKLSELIAISTNEVKGYIKRDNNTISFTSIHNNFYLLHWGNDSDITFLQCFLDDTETVNYVQIKSNWKAFSEQEEAILIRKSKDYYDVWIPKYQ